MTVAERTACVGGPDDCVHKNGSSCPSFQLPGDDGCIYRDTARPVAGRPRCVGGPEDCVQNRQGACVLFALPGSDSCRYRQD